MHLAARGIQAALDDQTLKDLRLMAYIHNSQRQPGAPRLILVGKELVEDEERLQP